MCLASSRLWLGLADRGRHQGGFRNAGLSAERWTNISTTGCSPEAGRFVQPVEAIPEREEHLFNLHNFFLYRKVRAGLPGTCPVERGPTETPFPLPVQKPGYLCESARWLAQRWLWVLHWPCDTSTSQ